jgi:hypothetical protein
VTAPAAIEGCIWSCAAEQLDDYAERLGAIFDVTLPRVDGEGLAMRSSPESGLHLISAPESTEPGVWGIVMAVDEAPGTRPLLPMAPGNESSQPVHEALRRHGLVYLDSMLCVHVYVRERSGAARTGLCERLPGPQPYLYLFVWVVRPENLDRHAGEFSALLGADFESVAIPGGRVAMSWDSGVELIGPESRELHPIAGPLDETTTDPHYEHLCTYGDSPWSIVLRVADIEAFRDRAVRLGHSPSPLLQPADPTQRREWYRSWTRKVIEQREIRLPSFLGLRLMAGEVTYRPQARARGLIGDAARRPAKAP